MPVPIITLRKRPVLFKDSSKRTIDYIVALKMFNSAVLNKIFIHKKQKQRKLTVVKNNPALSQLYMSVKRVCKTNKTYITFS